MNNKFDEKVVYGNELKGENPIKTLDKCRVRLLGADRTGQSQLFFDEEMLSRHLMFLGSIGTGKTNAILQLVEQIKTGMTDDDVLVIFDTKGDFYNNFFDEINGDIVISNDDRAMGKTHQDYWNIFNELLSENIEEEANEISQTLFYGKVKTTSQTFFPLSAKDIFAAIMISLHRKGEKPSNEDIKELLDNSTTEDLKNLLSKEKGLTALVSYIDGSGGQTQGVISELQQLAREIFVGNFKKRGSISIRNLIREKQRRTIFIEYDLAMGNTLTPIYRLLLDLAIKESLTQQSGEKKGNVYFIIDEFKLTPYLQHLSDGVNFGRSLGAKFAIGVQTIEQLYPIYGEHETRAILSGFSTSINFRLNDKASREYVSGLFGNNMKIFSYMPAIAAEGIKEQLTTSKVVEDWHITNLRLGEAIIGLPEQEPFIFRFDKFQEKKDSQSQI